MKKFLLEHGFESLIVIGVICLIGWVFPFGEIWTTHEQENRTLKVEYVNGTIDTLNLKVDKEATFCIQSSKGTYYLVVREPLVNLFGGKSFADGGNVIIYGVMRILEIK